MDKLWLERVSKGLQCCESKEHCHYGEDGCPFYFPENPDDCTSRLARMTLYILDEYKSEKEKAKEIVWDVLHRGFSIDTVPDQNWVANKINMLIDGLSEEESDQP